MAATLGRTRALLLAALLPVSAMAMQGHMIVEDIQSGKINERFADPEADGAFTIEAWSLFDGETEYDLPPVYLKAWGQERHVAPRSEIVVNGAHQVCFRNYTRRKEHAWYRFEVNGFGKSAYRESAFDLPPHSAVCASEPPYFRTVVGNAGRYPVEVYSYATLDGSKHQTHATGVIYVGS